MSELSKQRMRQVPIMLEIPVTEDSSALLSDLRMLLEEMSSRIQPPEPISYSEKEAAAELGLSEITLARLRRDGKISYAPVGTKARYTRAHLEEFLAANTKTRFKK